MADLAPQAAARSLTVTVDTIPLGVTGDPDRLLEAITNVVANAIAYNVPEGRVTVTMREHEGIGRRVDCGHGHRHLAVGSGAGLRSVLPRRPRAHP